VQTSAREVSIPSQNMFVHSILQHYFIDGQDGVLNPIGMLGRRLEADFHIIHGVANRIKNSIRCVKEVGPEVLDVVYAPWPTALAEAIGRSGGLTMGGDLMLLHQAAEQVRLMTNRPAPVEAMRTALSLATHLP
jgi:hypothetical protein